MPVLVRLNPPEDNVSDFDSIADSLISEYARDLPSAVADRAFRLAWEHGNLGGAGEVEAYFIDFADLAGDAYRAGLLDGA